jgi:hypothetical protein
MLADQRPHRGSSSTADRLHDDPRLTDCRAPRASAVGRNGEVERTASTVGDVRCGLYRKRAFATGLRDEQRPVADPDATVARAEAGVLADRIGDGAGADAFTEIDDDPGRLRRRVPGARPGDRREEVTTGCCDRLRRRCHGQIA